MNRFAKLKAGDLIDVIFPGRSAPPVFFQNITNILEGSGYKVRFLYKPENTNEFSSDSDENRLKYLIEAISNNDSKAIYCRGGYGSARILDGLHDANIKLTKPLVGFSDVTALHLFAEKFWQVPTFHGQLSSDKYFEEQKSDAHDLLNLLSGEANQVTHEGLELLNKAEPARIVASVTGGNLSLIQSSLGTFWQIDAKGKILLLEDIGERGYKIDRMLNHLRQAGVFDHVKAVIFGDFTDGLDPNGEDLTEIAIKRFANSCEFPVFRIPNIGHGPRNKVIPFGVTAKLENGVLSFDMGQQC